MGIDVSDIQAAGKWGAIGVIAAAAFAAVVKILGLVLRGRREDYAFLLKQHIELTAHVNADRVRLEAEVKKLKDDHAQCRHESHEQRQAIATSNAEIQCQRAEIDSLRAELTSVRARLGPAVGGPADGGMGN